MKIITWTKENYLLVGLILLSFLLRIYHLDYQSPWGDELFTLINANSNKPMGEIFSVLRGDVHPPLYYYIIHFFLQIFGDTAFVARFVSLLFGVGGVIALYYLGKELFNKNVALVAAFLMSINHFHIYYSQEARMYSMLCFATVLSFLYLIRFIKAPTLKTALIYSFGTALLVNTHFYALFALFAQYLIILYFIIKPYNSTGLKIFMYAFISGIITLVSFIPSIVIFQGTSGIKQFWITSPALNVYTAMFSELIGSEVAVVIAIIAILYFIFKIFNEEESPKFKIDPVKDNLIFAFQVFFIWVFISILSPYVLSFVHLPMIVSRYFVNILPPLFLLMSAGIGLIKSNTIKVTLLTVFVLFSLNDLVFVKQYYTRMAKTQFRDVGLYVKEKHKNNEKIYSSAEVYYSYYLKADENHKVINTSLNQLADRILSKQEKPESFWYLDTKYSANADPSSESTLALIDSLYVVDENVELFDAFGKHYYTKADYKPTGDFSKFKPYKPKNGFDAEFSFEVVNDLGNTVDVSGWAYFLNQSMEHSKISIVLINDKKDVVIEADSSSRPDVTAYFKSKFDISNSGFKKQINKNDLEPGTYKLALYLIDPITKKEALVISDKTITK